MSVEDIEPRAKAPSVKSLDDMSVESLRDYIGELEREIARVNEAIARKIAARGAAETFFKKTPL